MITKNRPFLKWPGNKYHCLEKILPRLPKASRLIEPFTGSGAIFINTNYPSYLLAEGNGDLIALFLFLQKQGRDFIAYCESFFIIENNSPEKYYALRKLFNETKDLQEKAALLLYLNRHGYNGLCRYNQSGGYNVPFGRYKKPYFPANELHLFYKKSKEVEFICNDFRDVFGYAKPGDLYYCDPPYLPLNKSSNFTQYNGKPFTLDDQIELAELAAKTAKKGLTVAISNHDLPLIRKYYKGATIYSFNVPRIINCQPKNRKPVKELLAVFSS